MQSLQDIYAPSGKCFGCGPANEKGLQIKSYVDGEGLICRFLPQPHHLAFTGVLNGGICGTLLDCHSNWTALWALKQRLQLEEAPLTVTADFHVRLKRPTPVDSAVVKRIVEIKTQNTALTAKEIVAQLKTEGVTASTKVVELVVLAYFGTVDE